MLPDNDYLSIRWKKRPMTASEYLAFSKELLQKLMQFDHMLDDDWLVSGLAPRYGHLAADMSDFDDTAFAYMFNKNEHYLNPDPDSEELTLASKSPLGFSLSYQNREKLNNEVTMTISAGDLTDRQTSLVNIEFMKSHPRRQDYTYLSALMKLLIEHCQPDYGFMTYGKIHGLRKDKVRLGDIFPIGWLTYLSDPSVNARLPKDIESEVLATGGTLITLKRALPSPDNAEDVAIATRIRDALVQPEMVNLEYLSETNTTHAVVNSDS